MTDLSAALAEEGIRLQSLRPGGHKTLCPKCSHTRKKKKDPCLSVTIDDDSGAVWQCHNFGCAWAGNVPGERNGRTYHPPKQVRRPAPAPVNPDKPDSLFDWFKARAISRETVEMMGVYKGSAWFPQTSQEEPCLVFPYLRGGESVNNKYRTTAKHFRQDKGARKILYNIDGLTDNDTAIFTEGEMDVLAFIEAGHPNAVTLPDGAPEKLKEEMDPDDKRYLALANCEDDLAKIEKFIIATDADAPGEALAEELARRLGKERCWRVNWPEGTKDANAVLVRDGPEKVRECIETAEPYPIRGLYQFRNYESEIWALYRGERGEAFSTGWPALDKLMRIRLGDLTVVTGTPNSGKSEFVDALLVNLAERHGWHFVMASFENDPDEHASKLAEKYLGKPFAEGPTPRMAEPDLVNALTWIDQHFAIIRADDEAPSIDWILERAKASVLRYGTRGLVIDPWNEIEHTRPRDKTETEFVGWCSARCGGSPEAMTCMSGSSPIRQSHPTISAISR